MGCTARLISSGPQGIRVNHRWHDRLQSLPPPGRDVLPQIRGLRGGEIGGEQVRLLTLVQVCVLVVISADSG
jgi:hypothetical protein